MKVLCLAAHADDEVLGCGATLARLAAEGHQVHVAILMMRHLRQQADLVAGTLGIHHFYTAVPCEDQRFDSMDMLDLIQIIEGVLSTLQPDVVYSHHVGDLNQDHALTAKALLVATRPKPAYFVKDLYACEIYETSAWAFNYAFRPNVFVEVSGFLSTKIEAMRLYESEVKSWPHPRSAESLAVHAKQRGSMVGVDAAEAFELVRSIR